MTWQVGPTVLTCQLTWHATIHTDVTIMSCWRHPYPGQSCGSGHLVFGSGYPIRAKKMHGARLDRHLVCACRRVRPCPTSDFNVVFTSGFVSSFSTQWYGQNTILTTFIFEQKSNTTLNHVLWYQLLGIPTGDVLIFAHWRLSTLTQCLTWFGKPFISTGEAISLYRERTRFTTIEEEESHPLFSNSQPHSISLFSVLQWQLLLAALGSPLSPIFLISLVALSLSALSFCCSLSVPIYRLQWKLLLFICQQW